MALTTALIEVNSALPAQPLTVLAAQRGQGKFQEDCVVHEWGEVNGIPVVGVGLVVTAAVLDVAFVDAHAEDARYFLPAATATTRPGAVDRSPHRETTGETRDRDRDFNIGANGNVTFASWARCKLTFCIKRCGKGNGRRRGNIAA